MSTPKVMTPEEFTEGAKSVALQALNDYMETCAKLEAHDKNSSFAHCILHRMFMDMQLVVFQAVMDLVRQGRDMSSIASITLPDWEELIAGSGGQRVGDIIHETKSQVGQN